MSNTWDNTNRGALFTNKRRTKDNHPAFTGKINVDGRDYWLSAWGKTSKAGEKFMSLSVSPIEETNTGPSGFDDFGGDFAPATPERKPAATSGVQAPDLDDSIPF